MISILYYINKEVAMSTKQFCVLHLSDLHIVAFPKGYYSQPLKKLIADIEIQLSSINEVVIVVSGDIIDKADYINNLDVALHFFKDLESKLHSKVKDIQIVPGNHDRIRTAQTKLFSYAHRNFGLCIGSDYCEDEWRLQQETYSDFFALVNKIYQIFGKTTEITNTFGVETLNIGNCNVCFIRLDTSWCSSGSDDDQRNLRVGRYQLDKLKENYQAIKGKGADDKNPISITIAISHHPITWLLPDEEDTINQYIMESTSLDVDVLMCGHVHQRAVLNYFNHEHSMLTLVTGMASDSKSNSKEEHKYSIYVFNKTLNSCEIIMRKTQTTGTFDYDFSVYTGKKEQLGKKICYPVKITDNHPFITSSSPNASLSKSLLVDVTVLEKIRAVSKCIFSFRSDIAKILEKYKMTYFQNMLVALEGEACFDSKIFTEKQAQFYEMNYSGNLRGSASSESDYSSFCGFLGEVCTYFADAFNEFFGDPVTARSHFRWYNNTEDTYYKLCSYTRTYNSSDDEADINNDVMSLVRKINWGGMIKASHFLKMPLVYSANPQLNCLDPLHWDDFITIVPAFMEYEEDHKTGKKTHEKRPRLTFGFSLKAEDYEKSYQSILELMYILDFLRLDTQIAEIIDDYLTNFHVDLKGFLMYNYENAKQ